MNLILKMLSNKNPLRLSLYNFFLKKYIKRNSKKPYHDLLDHDWVDRPHYAYSIYEAAKLAKFLGHKKVSILEFGVAGGQGLLNIEYHITQIKKEFDMDFEVYGFDLGTGLPKPEGFIDAPHIYSEGFYKMDQEALLKKLKFSKLVLGDVRETTKTFFQDYNPAPIGAALFDMDFYSSTVSAFRMFNCDHGNMLPRVNFYLDDVLNINKYIGVMAAVEKFNDEAKDQKIAKPNLFSFTRKTQAYWNHKLYILHNFKHADYDKNMTIDHQLKIDGSSNTSTEVNLFS